MNFDGKKNEKVSKNIIIILGVIVIAIMVMVVLYTLLFNVIPDIFHKIAGEHYHLQFGENITLDNSLDIKPYYKNFTKKGYYDDVTGIPDVKILEIKVEYKNVGNTDFSMPDGDVFILKYRGTEKWGYGSFRDYYNDTNQEVISIGETQIAHLEFKIPEDLRFDECKLYLSKEMEYTSGERYRVTWALS